MTTGDFRMGAVPDGNPEEEAGRGPAVLVVEDEFLVRTSISAYLRDVGFTVIEAVTAAEAKAVFASGTTVDIVFADIRLPGDEDGLSLADWVKRQHGEVPVLVTSGSFSLRDPANLTPHPFMPKPYIYYRVEQRLRELLGAKGASAP